MSAQEHLDILYNEFMIRRMMVARLGEDRAELLNISNRILSIVLEASQFGGSRGNIVLVPWLVSHVFYLSQNV